MSTATETAPTLARAAGWTTPWMPPYRAKYGRSSSAVARITADVARATTLRVDPA